MMLFRWTGRESGASLSNDRCVLISFIVIFGMRFQHSAPPHPPLQHVYLMSQCRVLRLKSTLCAEKMAPCGAILRVNSRIQDVALVLAILFVGECLITTF